MITLNLVKKINGYRSLVSYTKLEEDDVYVDNNGGVKIADINDVGRYGHILTKDYISDEEVAVCSYV